eukprot:TRINITY_DN7388_c0_g1_i1.p1 TRINITY_DN7388_c0_g1~~TRINITY_DN7388_c0_g1_i1.p1  ORF type:complete len:282 (+),score=42.12 TRINITY_DN7388_c0_g1_i1:92-847(+)
MDINTYDVTSLVHPGQTRINLGIARGTDCLVHMWQVFSSPTCQGPPADEPCCNYAKTSIDLMVFVANTSLSGACSRLMGIFTSPSSTCWVSAIADVCGLNTDNPVEGCLPVYLDYSSSRDASLATFRDECALKEQLVEVLAAQFKNEVDSKPCTAGTVRSLLQQLEDQLQALITSVDSSVLVGGIAESGAEHLGLACGLPGANFGLCGPETAMCTTANTQSGSEAVSAVTDASYIVGAQAIVSLGGVAVYC